MFTNPNQRLIATLFTAILFGWACSPAAAAIHIEGQVQGARAPIANSTVTLWMASISAPSQLAQGKTDANGRFEISVDQSPTKETSFYLVATGGEPAVNKAGGNNPAIGLMAVVSNTPPPKVTINEFTTVASVWTHNQFIDGMAIKGPALSLIAGGNVPNFVDLQTGGWGSAIQDSLNSSQTPTMANFATLRACRLCHARDSRCVSSAVPGRHTAEGRGTNRHAHGRRGNCAVSLVSARPAVHPAWAALSYPAGQDHAHRSIHALSKVRTERMGPAAQIRWRWLSRGRRSEVR
jgi:hypothetical protein